jgi:8-oxo-dGTP diphosphatase
MDNDDRTSMTRNSHHYVLGFLFTPERERVVLLQKARPSWQAGKLNGVGGHIEQDESPDVAMEREANEETGVINIEWEEFTVVYGLDWCMHVFRAFDTQADEATNLEDEPVTCCDPLNLPPNVLTNLRWLVPMALDDRVPRLERTHVDCQTEAVYPLPRDASR